MASWGTVFLLLTVLTAALTKDTASQDLRAPEHGQKSLLVAEGVQEAREARGKEVEVPEEVKAKRILKKKKKMKKEEKKGDQKSEEKKKKRRKKKVKGGKKGDLKNKEKRRKKVKKEGKRGNQKNGEKKKRRRRKKVKKEGKRGNQKNEEKKRKKRKGMARKACPGGQCVPAAEQCGDGRAVRAATCKSGVCCVTASKKKGEKGDARGKKKKKKKCKPRNPCKKVWGKCASKKKGCPSGQTMLVSTKEIKYCSKKNCVCCTDEVQQPACVSKKCAKKKGFCTTDKSECSGKIKVQKSFCSGANCVCCLPAKQCKIQKDCLDLGGTCVDMKKSEECKTKPLVGKNYCKGKCGCCVPEGPSITTDDFDVFPTTTRRPFKPKMWSYHGDTGPDFWSLTNPLCSGFRQSPLNFGLAGMKNMLVDPFNFKYYDTVPNSITLENNGHAVVLMFEMPGDPPQFTGGDLNGTYFFRQAHLHWGMTSQEGSEHLMNSRSYPAELHMVHYKADYGSITDALQHSDGLAVLGIMIDYGNTVHPVLAAIAAELNEIVEPKTTTTLTKPVPLQDFLPHDLSTFYRYKGSLTTPPCLELVMWTVFMDKLITTEESMAPFHKLKDVHNQQLSGNFRPKQRETELHEPYIAHTKDY